MPSQEIDTTESPNFHDNTVTTAVSPAWGSIVAFADARKGGKVFWSTGIMLENQSGAQIEFSKDGVNVDGTLAAGVPSDKWFDNFEAQGLYFRSTAGGDALWVTAWGE